MPLNFISEEFVIYDVYMPPPFVFLLQGKIVITEWALLTPNSVNQQFQ